MSAQLSVEDVKQKHAYAAEVGWLFLKKYYSIMCLNPPSMYKFYEKVSTCTYGKESDPITLHIGADSIKKVAEQHNFEGKRVFLSNIDSQICLEGGIIIMVVGEICEDEGPPQKFAQTFFLASHADGYYVLNDIFRYIKMSPDSSWESYQTSKEQKPDELSQTPSPSDSPKTQEPKIQEQKAHKVASDSVQKVSDSVQKVSDSVQKVSDSAQKVSDSVQKVASESIQVESPPRVTYASLAAESINSSQQAKADPEPLQPQKTAKPAKKAAPQYQKSIGRSERPFQRRFNQDLHQNYNGSRESFNKKDLEEKNKASVYIRGVTEAVTREMLNQKLAAFGPVASLDLNPNRLCAFAEFESPDTLQKVIGKNLDVCGVNLYVEARRKYPRPHIKHLQHKEDDQHQESVKPYFKEGNGYSRGAEQKRNNDEPHENYSSQKQRRRVATRNKE